MNNSNNTKTTNLSKISNYITFPPQIANNFYKLIKAGRTEDIIITSTRFIYRWTI